MNPDRSISLARTAPDSWCGRFNAMAGSCEVLLRGAAGDLAENITTLVANETWRIEEKFSRYRPDSVVSKINSHSGEAVVVDEETAQLLDFSASLFDISKGRFDITSGILRQVWRFDGGKKVPSREALGSILRHVGWEKVEWIKEKRLLTLAPDMEIDFGGIGKEYAVDRACIIIEKAARCSCLVNFGGDIAIANPDEQAWQIGIETLQGGEEPPKILAKRGALATSGDLFRFVMHNGRRLPHILDPKTGWPVADAPHSVTVAAPTCLEAGMLATLSMLEGGAAEEFLRRQGVQNHILRNAG